MSGNKSAGLSHGGDETLTCGTTTPPHYSNQKKKYLSGILRQTLSWAYPKGLSSIAKADRNYWSNQTLAQQDIHLAKSCKSCIILPWSSSKTGYPREKFQYHSDITSLSRGVEGDGSREYLTFTFSENQPAINFHNDSG